jgi:hypothetical protein
MKYVIADLNDNSITINDVPYTKVYDFKIGTDTKKVTLKNVFDSQDVIFRNVDVSDIEIEGVEYETALEVMDAFEPLKKKVAEDGNDSIPNLQKVLTEGNTSDIEIIITSEGEKLIMVRNTNPLIWSRAALLNRGSLWLGNKLGNTYVNSNLLTDERNLELPDKSGTLATLESIIPITGTQEDNPVSGSIEISGGNKIYADDGTTTGSVIYDASTINIESYKNDDTAYASVAVMNDGNILIQSTQEGNSASLTLNAYGTKIVKPLFLKDSEAAGFGSIEIGDNTFVVRGSDGVISMFAGSGALGIYNPSNFTGTIYANNVDGTNKVYDLPNKSGTIPVIGLVAPSSATDTGVTGEIRVTSTFVYFCIGPNQWRRAALSTW